MSRQLFSLVVLAGAIGAITACSSATADGKLVDGITGEPIGKVRVIAKKVEQGGSMTCQTFEAETNEQGAFKIEGLCEGEYAIKLSDEGLWLAETDTIPDGGGVGMELKAWRAPTGSGLYKLSGTEIEPLRTAADLKKEKIKDTDETAAYPGKVPNKLPLVAPTDYLVVVGQGTINDTKIEPLIASGPRVFGDAETNVKMEPWSYIGIQFTDDATFERVAAQVDEGKTFKKEKGDRIVKYIPGSALPAGRYALYRPDGRTVTLLDFGESQSKKEEPQAAAE